LTPVHEQGGGSTVSERNDDRARDAESGDFVPRGAVAFMAFMILAYAATWIFFYGLMVGRA
jgi:hypothetical protein